MSPEKIIVFLQSLGFLGPVTYILIVFTATVISPLTSVFFWPAVLVVWGFPAAPIYTILGSVGGAVANYWIARKFGRPVIKKVIGKKGVDLVDKISLEAGIRTLIILRLFSNTLFDYISYAAGLIKMNFFPYFLITGFFSVVYIFVAFLIMDKALNIIGAPIYFASGFILAGISILVGYLRVKKGK